MRKGGGAPTLQDVARRADVSTATVSRVLNAPGMVREDTRKRVMRAIDELGYAPNFGASALAARRTRTIGAVIPTMDNAIFAQGLEAFQARLRTAGYTLLVASSGYDMALEAEEIRTLVARGADALLLIGHERSPDVTGFLERRAVPCVVAWAHAPSSPMADVGFDNRAAMQALAARVIAMGHRRIGVITAPRKGNDRARERVEGIRAAAREAGLGAAALELVEAPYGIGSGAAAFGRLMRRPLPPSVVMCGNDVLAAGAIVGARRAGLAVPGDVSVTGFDDIELATLLDPELTTVRVPHRQMGELAAESLLAALETGAGPVSHRLQTEIVMRGSLGPPQG